ncbi:hypothetical protein NL676_012573 [Syzygium grande]|nr:hypothetical protein NL676_012573 [Syzygium grande]
MVEKATPVSVSFSPSTDAKSSTLIAINASPVSLSSSHHPTTLSGVTQFMPLLVGYNLLGYIDNSLPKPTKTSTDTNEKVIDPNLAYALWNRSV